MSGSRSEPGRSSRRLGVDSVGIREISIRAESKNYLIGKAIIKQVIYVSIEAILIKKICDAC